MVTATAVGLVYRAKEMPAAMGVGKTKFYEIVKCHDFPEPIALGARARAYYKSEVDSWMQAQKIASKNRLVNTPT